MKKIKQYIIAIFLITILINTAYGFPPGMANRSSNTSSNTNSNTQLYLNDTTQSEQDIQSPQHLIEVDAVQFQSENKLYVRETLIFKNTGTKNFSGMLRTWVPDGAEGIRVGKLEMMMGGATESISNTQNGNIISWQDFIGINSSLPPLYTVEYMFTASPNGEKSKNYSKKFLYPTLINKMPGSIILKVTKNKDDNIAITDENGNSILASGNPSEENNSILYGWMAPTFTDINVEISKPIITSSGPVVTSSGIAGYAIIGFLVLLVFSYPVIRDRSEKLQVIEGRIRDSLRGERGVDSSEDIEDKITEEIDDSVALDNVEFTDMKKDELENERNEILSKLNQLNKDYASGNLLDEEYEELQRSYQERIKKITKRIKIISSQ